MEQHLLEGVKIDADNPLVPVAIGSVVGALGDTTAKTALMDRLSEVMAGHPQLALAQAQVAMESGDHAKAIKGLRNLFNSRPKDVAVFEALLRAQVAANELVPAAGTAEDWLKAHPEDDQVRARLAQIYLRQGDRGNAVKAYRAVLGRSPDDAVVLNNLAMLVKDQDAGEALGFAERAHQLRPNDAAIADTLGSILLAKGDVGRAVPVLAGAFAAASGNPTIAFHYASALAEAGKDAEARRILLELGEKSFPEREQAKDLLTRLSRSQKR
jgi:predicted Zn-dependent protease